MDIPATLAAVLVGLNRKTTQRIYSLLRDRIVELAIQEVRPFVGDTEVDKPTLEPNEFEANVGAEPVGKPRMSGSMFSGPRMRSS